MVIFPDSAAADRAATTIKEVRQKTRHKAEFKFSNCSNSVRDEFFDQLRNEGFSVRAIVVDKRKIHDVHMRTDTEDFYRYFVRLLLTHDNKTLKNARIRIDGSGDRKFRRELNRYLRSHAADGRIHSVTMKDSSNSDLIQLADMCAGAIHRHYKHQNDRGNAGRWYQKLKPRLEDIWTFPGG